MLRRSIVSIPTHARSISLFENVKRILSRTKASESTSIPTTSSELSEARTVSAPIAKSGQTKALKPKIIGHDVQFPERISDAALLSALSSTFDAALGPDVSILRNNKKFRVARQITLNTGRRVPDAVLNAAKTKQDIIRFFEKQKRDNDMLVLEEAKLPGNVRITK